MSEFVAIQYQDGQNNWRELSRILGKTNSQQITHSMKQLQRQRPNSQIDIMIEDRLGNPIKPREWFMVPLDVIKEAIDRIVGGTILDYIYDPATAALVKR